MYVYLDTDEMVALAGPAPAAVEAQSKQRIQARCRAIHEELIAVVFHPDRIHSLIALYGQDVVEHM
jgi:hypothetical protein